jgi:hypothetical protein
MRKVFGGVTMHQEGLLEKYTVSVKNEDGTVQILLQEQFNRKKVYGVDFVIKTANELLEQKLTQEEIDWLQNVDPVELQTEILNVVDVSQ